MVMKNLKVKPLCDFMILTARYESNPKAIVWNGSEKFMSVKIHGFEKKSVAKIFWHVENKI